MHEELPGMQRVKARNVYATWKEGLIISVDPLSIYHFQTFWALGLLALTFVIANCLNPDQDGHSLTL